MKSLPACTAILGLALTTWLPAKEAAPSTPAGPAAEVKDPVLEAKNKEQEVLATENKLQAERLVQATNSMRAEVAQLKLERELMTEKVAFETTKRQVVLQAEFAKVEAEKEKLTQEGELSKVRAEKLTNDLKSAQTEAALEVTRLQGDIARIETAEKDRELPIFIVIDASPGGSVMAGYRILKAMESSDAPIHVVVKSFAASMAAAITTLAKESYAYPNAVILHHQISAVVMGQLNLTQQREFHDESQRWWARFGTPIASKMGITPDEFIKRMYAQSSSGDWSEFGEQAKDLKWVNHIVNGIDETSFTRDPDSVEPSKAAKHVALNEEVDASGKPFVWLPRLNPKDVYFLYNSDDYYRMR